MRALSLKQPFAHVVLHYGKSIENRRWRPVDPELLEELRTSGFLLHAAKGMTRAYYAEAEAFIFHALGLDALGAEAIAARAEFRRDFAERAKFGGIVGRTRLAEIILPNERRGLGADAIGTYPDGVDPSWHMREQFAFVLAGTTPLSFTPLKGGLGFFRVPEHIASSLDGLS
jgi:hypothetical protein